jgi:hypothetical protein
MRSATTNIAATSERRKMPAFICLARNLQRDALAIDRRS